MESELNSPETEPSWPCSQMAALGTRVGPKGLSTVPPSGEEPLAGAALGGGCRPWKAGRDPQTRAAHGLVAVGRAGGSALLPGAGEGERGRTPLRAERQSPGDSFQ